MIFLPPEAAKILRKLRSCQRHPGMTVFVQYDTGEFLPESLDSGKCGDCLDHEHSVSFKQSRAELTLILEELARVGYIKDTAPEWNSITVTHIGHHRKHAILTEISWFLFHSIWVPIFVSAATAVVVYLISEWLFPILTSLLGI